MKLRSYTPFWPLRDGIPASYPALERDVRCDVLVIGGGLTGAMAAYHLANAGVEVVLVDKRDIGLGSTAASTALAMYEPDMNLTGLIELRGERFALQSYKECLAAVRKLRRLVKGLKGECGFEWKESLYLESGPHGLRTEFEKRKKHGFDADYISEARLKKHFSFPPGGAILSMDGAQVDPFLLTHLLLTQPETSDQLRTFDRTEIVRIANSRNGIIARTDRDCRVRASKVVYASGYETAEYLRRRRNIVHLKSTYAMVTEPVPGFQGWAYDDCMIWDSKQPYNYLRSTLDGRIMIGGEDEDFVNPARRDKLIPRKTRKLLRSLRSMFPKLSLEVAYSWAGTFGETEDSLPFVGELKGFPNAFFALAYGANGTIFGLMAAEIIRDLYLGRKNVGIELFSFDRQKNISSG